MQDNPPQTDRNRRIVFIGGLHRSGTTLLFRCLRDHPQVSGFQGTGAPMDEGQHLQDVYPTDEAHGGPGRFGFDSAAVLTEASSSQPCGDSERLFARWAARWDLSRPLLLEKSPPNVIRTRYLQALFPNAAFVLLVRHPAPVSLSTRKWTGQSVCELVRHWLICHERLAEDLPRLRHAIILRYERLVKAPQATMRQVRGFLGLSEYPSGERFDAGVNKAYFEQWRWELDERLAQMLEIHEDGCRQFGYSLEDLEWSGPSVFDPWRGGSQPNWRAIR